jgi:penicillin-binding protein 1A
MVYEDYDNWCPKNSNNKYGGFYSMKGALANSVNTVSAQLIMEAGIGNTISLAHEMGIKSKLPEVPSLSLGTGEISLLEMVNAYCVFLNQGKTIEPRYIRRIEDANGKLLYADPAHSPGNQAMSAATAQTMLKMMQEVVDHGSAYSLRSIWGMNNDMAGKPAPPKTIPMDGSLACTPKWWQAFG